jgi:hypothetical protein
VSEQDLEMAWLEERLKTLREIDSKHQVQKDEGLTVRWFRGQGIELQVWLDRQGEVDHFQYFMKNRVL